MRNALFFAASLTALAAATTAQAQASADTDAGAIAEVVVTSGPLPVSLDSATTHVEILGRGQLDLKPPAGLGDTLADVPGLRSTAFGPGASRPVIRGLSGARVLVLQNGVGMVDASTLSPDHAVASDPAEATRIEILRGPSTLAYGGSGIGGVVNIIDERVPTHAPAKPVEGRVSASYGSVDDNRAVSGGLTFGQGPIVFTFDGATRQSDDYKVPVNPVSDRLAADLGVMALPDRKVLNTDVKVDTYGGGVSYVHSRGFVGVSVKRTGTDYGVPYAQISPEDPDAEGPVGISLRQSRYDLRAEQQVDFGPFAKVRANLGHADYHHEEIERATGDVGTQFLSSGTEGRLELVQKDRGGWQGAVGFQGLKRDLEAIGDEAFIPPVKVEEGGVFILQRYERPTWGVEGGLRLDNRRLKTATDSRSFTNGSFSAGVFARPGQDWFLALSLAHNRRAPTELELFADGPHPGTNAFEIGDPTLTSETVNSAEVTARYATGNLRIEGHAFVARYDGFIDARPDGTVEDGLAVFRHVQIDADFVGAEAEGAWTFWRSGARSLALEGSFDWVRGSSDAGPPARIPPWSGAARLVYADGRFGAEAELRHVATQNRTAAFETSTDGYELVNLTASVRPWSARAVRFFVEGRNLANVEAREHVSFLKNIAPLPGRSFRVGMSANF
ncbi:MAG: TonB-dependent receptor [Caulobacterales bacterium 32-69-10]|nr:MAG: TonB-dependent receptor [Caulobacterales bacterium 32-69-10]